MPLRLAEAQTLYEGLKDPLLRPGLEAFFQDQRNTFLDALLGEVMKRQRDTLRESFIAGKVDAAQTAMLDLAHFAERQMKEASQ